MVRRTIHRGWVSSKPISRSWSWPMSWMWRAAASRRNRPVRSMSPTRNGHCAIENVRVTVGHRHQLFIQAHGVAPRFLLVVTPG